MSQLNKNKLQNYFKSQDIIANRKYNELSHKANEMGILTKCRLCGKNIVGRSNSHSIPRSILRNIITDGTYYNITYAITDGIVYGPLGRQNKTGLNNTGTFHLLCTECENKTFKDYENKEFIDSLSSGKKEALSDKILAEIMLKSALRERYKKEFSKNITTLYNNELRSNGCFDLFSTKADELSINEDNSYIDRCLRIINNNQNNKFIVFYFDILDHPSCFAGQPFFPIQKTVTNKTINDVFNYDTNYSIVLTQFVVFPTKHNTICFAYCLSEEYERIKPYEDYLKTLSSINAKRKLFQSTLFMYTEEIYTNKKGIEAIKQDDITYNYIKSCIETSTTTEELLQKNILLEKPYLISPNNFRKVKFLF